ncbi:putative mrc1-like domain-containing protein [Botrytis cinerea BcDW1]|uniref:Putative mrc1-like domain-containing protein n=1 Tax=Botryotinia fuckeliana (strain BcDW1) TaxID=1290391 RepID=M7UJ43_BOTF1|nr:putative mrc1-like domain-containing protein [Botrytis cinerea BcDW1]
MASSRESSPGASISPMELTPKSKIRAALAAAGISDSDEESVSGNARKRVASRKPKSDKSNANSQSTALGRTEGSINVGSQTSSDEEEIARPRGRMAARMQAALDGSDDDQLVANNPRERVRRLLKNKPRPESPKVADDGSHADESDMPEVLRRRKTGSSPRQTPVKPIPRQESASPGLFVTPSAGRSATPQADASDPDDFQLDSISKSNKTFQDLVARRRQERHAREAEDRKKKAAKAEERKRQAALIEDDNQVDSEDEGGQRLTQQNRPTRKASKRAIEEMHRETQRLSRNMQLAHKATNKKKITKQSLFAKFGYRQAEETNAVSSDPARPTSSSPPPALQSDIEMQETPPTSPPDEMDPNDKQELAGSSLVTSMAMDVVEEDLPTLEEALKSTLPSRRDKGKGKDVDTELTEASSEKKPAFKQRPIRVRPAKVMTGELELDSDSDLEIVKPKKSARNAKLDAIFKRIPEKQATEPHSMMALRMLAHLRSPGKQNSGRNQKPSITAQDLQISLQLKARQQAHREREERLQALRDRGIIVQTAEEREKEMAEVDDLLAKARREGEEIQAREKAAAKRERKANGELDPLNDSSDDEEWQETNEIPEEEEISGSEDNEHEDSENEESDEGEDEENEEEEATDNPVPNPLFDDEAEEDEESEIDLSIPEDSANLMDAEDEEETLPVHRRSRKSRVTNIIPDDEEEEDLLTKTPRAPRTISLSHPRTDSPVIPTSVLRSATKTFIPGLPITGPAGLGLTQIFQGTMDDSQDIFESSGLGSQTLDVKEHSMDFLRRRAMPELPDFVPTMDDEETQDMVMDSQTQIQASQPVDNETQGIQVSFSQSQIHDFDSLVDNPLSTQISEFPNTQDEGFSMITPIKSRFMDPPSTAGTFKMGSPSTQMINDDIQETPIMKKKGKLRRRARAISVSDEDESLDAAREDNNQNEDFEITADAFDVMRKAAKKKPKVVDEFDKKKSNAKNMVNEQAEESEDEYAGLGGASDDESGGEEDAFVKEMIDDEKKDIDESELAKFYADHERASDEKQIEKLYNDISKGMLRRKRGADYDLSDSDDGGEARQRRKRAAEAKMRKALLADEKIGKIAQNPKKEAFLRAIEDRGSDDEMGFLDDFQEKDDTSDSQSQTQNDESQQSAPNQSGEVMGPPPKRKNSDSNGYVRPPPHLRRTGKKPSNLSEVRESLSSLIEDPHAMVTSTNFESDSDDDLEIEGGPEQETQKNRDPFAIRRTGTSIIDRIQLKRESSSNVAANNERLAFAAPSSQPGHRVVPLLRKATTNSSILSGTSSTGVSIGMSATERMAGGKDEGSGIRRGGGKHSGVNSFVRESERKAVMEKKEKRREQKKFKGVESRRKAVGGLFGKGTFE